MLHDITFNIRAGERVGVVGRTGSGKVRASFVSGLEVLKDPIEFSDVGFAEMYPHRG